MTAALTKLSSLLLMLVFTGFSFVVLAVSVVLLTAESLVSALLSPAKAPKKGSLNEALTRKRVASGKSQSFLRFWTSP
jgi:hypothetical protein